MIRRLFLPLFILLVTSCDLATAPQTPVQAAEEIDEDENNEMYWNGPGWYWGIYINNEDEYWNHYDQRYPNRQGMDHDRRGGEGRARGEGHGGGHR